MPDHAQHVVGICDNLSPIKRRTDFGGEFVGLDVATTERSDHTEILLRDVVEGEVSIGQFGHAHHVVHEAASEADGTGSDYGDFNGRGVKKGAGRW